MPENLGRHTAHDARDIERHGETKDVLGFKPPVQETRYGDNGGKHQQICRGEPLNSCGIDPKFAHQRWKRDIHRRLYAHARK